MIPANAAASQISTTTQQLGATLGNEFKFVGLDETLAELRKRCVKPKINWQNALYTAVFVNGASGGVIDNVNSEDSSLSGIGVFGTTLILSGAAQFQEFCAQHSKLQELQEGFIKGLPFSEIIGYGESVSKLNTNITANSTDDVIKYLYKNDKVTILMKEGIQLNFKNNSVCSIRIIGASLACVVLSAAFAGLYIAYRLQEKAENDAGQNNNGTSASMAYNATTGNSTTQVEELSEESVYAALIGSSLPFNKLYGFIVTMAYMQEYALFLAATQVIKAFYEDEGKIDEIPDGIKTVMNHFLADEDREANKQTIDRCREFKLMQAMEDRMEQRVNEATEGIKRELQARMEALETEREEESRRLLENNSSSGVAITHSYANVKGPNARKEQSPKAEGSPPKCVIC